MIDYCEICGEKEELKKISNKLLCKQCGDYIEAIENLEIRYKGLYAKAKHLKDV
jgi:hypothetical protein